MTDITEQLNQAMKALRTTLQTPTTERAHLWLGKALYEIERLRAALDDLVSAVDAHNKANGRTMIDPHATEAARTLGSPKATTPEE